MPGEFVSWQEVRHSLLLRVALGILLLVIYAARPFSFNHPLMYGVFVIIIAQVITTAFGIPRHWSWLPGVNFYLNRLALVLLLGATGGGSSPFVAVSYIALVAALIWYNTRRSVVILVGSHWLALFAGAALAGEVGFPPTWSYCLLQAIGMAIIAHILSKPLSQLNHHAATDPLTHALNRRGGFEVLETWIAQRQPFALIFIDLKGFKLINDTYGHAVGDEVLAWVAQVCRSTQRSGDLVIRYGGDEFVLAVLGRPGSLIQRLEERLNAGFQSAAGHLSIQANLGVVHFPEDGRDLEQLIRLADQHMYAHKGVDLATT
ncbi:sensor domain-containing diguanylate cyclase [Calidithermus roseus]|uniref:Putative diguanylate cyclase YdaM n=1 Tax=Calidithermus roseus TaxID=1644118 RepID=A0A399EJV6_9DEIN|nr:GGDEF domain-containing protein [Calidithermus roseus]RIH84218.1 putative diguanylate cyclase YdaM [Calidithermus roseus]